MEQKTGFESVYSTSDKGTVAFIKSLLGSNSIKYYVDNEHAASLAFGSTSGIMTVMVAGDQAESAKELLKDITM